jgi:hypothetical protein
MKSLPYIHKDIHIKDGRAFTIQQMNAYMEAFERKIPMIHTFIYYTDFPKRIQLMNNLEHNPYHLLFYMIAPFYYVDDGKSPIQYFYGKENNHKLSVQALESLPPRFQREYEKESRIEYVQLPGCKWNIDWIDEKWIYSYVRDLYKHIWESTVQEKGKRIYISRHISRVSQRAILNEDDLKPVLKGVGVEYCVLEDMSFIDTILLFKSAEFVSGSHGGGLSWIIFCDPGTKFLEIYKKKRLKEHYTYVAQQCKLQSFRFSGVFDDPGVAAPCDPKIVDDGHMVLNIPNYLAAIRQLTTV